MSKDKNGTATIEFPILRWMDVLTGEFLTKEPENFDDESIEEVEIVCTIEAHMWYDAGRYSGAPEDCYPEESGFEIMEFKSDNPKITDFKQLTKEEQAAVEEQVGEAIGDDYGIDDYDYDYDF